MGIFCVDLTPGELVPDLTQICLGQYETHARPRRTDKHPPGAEIEIADQIKSIDR